MPMSRGNSILSTVDEVEAALTDVSINYTTLYFHSHPVGDRLTPSGRSRIPLPFRIYGDGLAPLRNRLHAIIADGGQVLAEGPCGNVFSRLAPLSWTQLPNSSNSLRVWQRTQVDAEQNLRYWHQNLMEATQHVLALESNPPTPAVVSVDELLQEVSTWDDVMAVGKWPEQPEFGHQVWCGDSQFFWVRFLPTIIPHPVEPDWWSITTQVDMVFTVNGDMPRVGYATFHPHAYQGTQCWGEAESRLQGALRDGHLVMALEIIRRWRVGISAGLLCTLWSPCSFYCLQQTMGLGHLLNCPVWDARDGTRKTLRDVYDEGETEEQAYLAGRLCHWQTSGTEHRALTTMEHPVVQQIYDELSVSSSQPGQWGDVGHSNTIWRIYENTTRTTFMDPSHAVRAIRRAQEGGMLYGIDSDSPVVPDPEDEDREPDYDEEDPDR